MFPALGTFPPPAQAFQPTQLVCRNAGSSSRKRQVESSLAFYDKVVDIWYKFLASVRSDASLAENVGKAQLSEGMDMLARVLSTRVNLLGDTHIATVSEVTRCPGGLRQKFRVSIGHLPLLPGFLASQYLAGYLKVLSEVFLGCMGFL